MRCYNCGVDIPSKLFGKYNRCRDCHNEKGRSWRSQNRERNNALHRLRRKARKEEILLAYFDKADYIAKAKSKPCMDCGVEYPPYVMHFDHVRGEKSRILSHMKTYSVGRIQQEIDKCDVVCSNCHAERTERRRIHAYLHGH